MAHFAKLGINGKVIGVHVVNNSDILNGDGVEDETIGQQFLERLHGWPAPMWIQTSYNTREGKHYTDGVESADQSKALRGNYAGVGKIYDEDNNIFRDKQPYASWVFNMTTVRWEPPIPRPVTRSIRSNAPDGRLDPYLWNESTGAWDIQRKDTDIPL